jgi:DNA end-binding protein Ku
MARAIWSGAISFGLVNVPVKVYAAVREHTTHFHQLDKGSGSRIHYEKVAEKTGKEVSGDEIALGYEVEKGKLVVVDPDELAALQPKTTRTIDITDFVDITDIDPVYYQRDYWLAPDGEGANRPYRLLAVAMEDRAKVGIGMVVMRNKQYLAAVRPRHGALSLSTMHFADEVLDSSAIEQIPDGRTKPAAKELKLATQIVDSLSGPWKPEQYRDTYTDEVQKLIAKREKGEKVVVDEATEQPDNVTDLMEALQASLDAAKKGKGAKRKKASSSASRRKSA